MHFKQKSIILSIFLCILFLFASCVGRQKKAGDDEEQFIIGGDEISAGTEIYQNINIPEFKGAYNVKRNTDYPELKKILYYNIDLPYPPNALIEFYDKFFSKLDMKIYESTVRQWRFHKSIPRLYSSNWIDNNESITAHLRLYYRNHYKNNKHVGYYLEVTSYVRPFVNCEECIHFIKANKDTDEGKKFFQFTVKYSNNGVFDVEKALEMNPNNSLLKEWAEIRKRYKKQLQTKYRAYAEKI